MTSARIQLVKGDITQLKVDAIVNAANSTLLGGDGVDGAIHWAAGPQLLAECKTLRGCNVGEAKITRGYNLPAKYVIHTVGPVWQDGYHNEDKLLKKCYLNSLKLVEAKGIKTIAFPNISTGVYGFPKVTAAKIAVETVEKYLSSSKLAKVIFCVFNDENYQIYNKLLSQ